MAPGKRAVRTRDLALCALAVVVFAVVALTYVRAVREFPLNVDAGYWIPHARLVARGMVPIVDFDTAYAPGPYYLFALLGQRGLQSPALVKAGVYAFEFLGALVLFAILRRHGSSRAASALYVVVYLAWIATCDGLAVEVEPAQTLFALASLWFLSRPCGAGAVLAAGALAGTAVLMKQYSVLFLPPLAFAAAICEPRATSTGRWSGRWTRVALFAAAIPVAFLAFALFTGQDAVHAFVRLATYGGASYPADGIVSMLGFLATGRAARPVGLALALGAWMLWRRRTPRTIVLFAGLALASAPFYVRNYEHYVQLAAPWTVLVVAEFLRGVDFAPVSRSPRTIAVAVAAAACLAFELAPIATGLAGAHRLMERRSIGNQIAIAREIEKAIPASRDVLIVNFEWVYVVSALEQPLPRTELRYTQGLESLADVRDAARFAVLGPGRVPIDEARAWLEAGGLRVFAVVEPQIPVLLFDRAPR